MFLIGGGRVVELASCKLTILPSSSILIRILYKKNTNDRHLLLSCLKPVKTPELAFVISKRLGCTSHFKYDKTLLLCFRYFTAFREYDQLYSWSQC